MYPKAFSVKYSFFILCIIRFHPELTRRSYITGDELNYLQALEGYSRLLTHYFPSKIWLMSLSKQMFTKFRPMKKVVTRQAYQHLDAYYIPDKAQHSGFFTSILALNRFSVQSFFKQLCALSFTLSKFKDRSLACVILNPGTYYKSLH